MSHYTFYLRLYLYAIVEQHNTVKIEHFNNVKLLKSTTLPPPPLPDLLLNTVVNIILHIILYHFVLKCKCKSLNVIICLKWKCNEIKHIYNCLLCHLKKKK